HRDDDRKDRGDDPKRRKRQPRPDHLIKQTAKSGDQEQQEKNRPMRCALVCNLWCFADGLLHVPAEAESVLSVSSLEYLCSLGMLDSGCGIAVQKTRGKKINTDAENAENAEKVAG